MGYGLGILLLVFGLILALAVDFSAGGIDIQTIGWILTLAGIAVIALTAVQMNARRRQSAVRTTTHADGSQTVQETQRDSTPPPPAV
jgi:uncharacterized protein YacL